MKNNNMVTIGLAVVLAAVVLKPFLLPENEQAQLKKAVAKLNQFGARIKQANRISPADAKIIAALAATPIPSPKLIKQQTLVTAGITFNTQQAIILNSITGKSVKSCGKAQGRDQVKASKSACKTQVVNPSKFLQTALNISQPIAGEIIKNGKKIPAKFVVGVTALFEGSQCFTVYLNGIQYEFCFPS